MLFFQGTEVRAPALFSMNLLHESTNFFRLEGSVFVKFQQQVEMQAHSLFTAAMGVSASGENMAIISLVKLVNKSLVEMEQSSEHICNRFPPESENRFKVPLPRATLLEMLELP